MPPEGRRFKPGQSGNPRGAGAHNHELKAIRRLTKEDVATVGALILEGNLDRLKEVSKDPNASVIKVWFASVAIKAISRGDPSALNIILNRIIGRVPEEIRHTGADGGPMQIANMTPDQAKAEAQAILERIRSRDKPT